MTTTQLIKRLKDLAEIGIVNAREDTTALLEAADRLHELRAKADPKWYQWLIMDDGLVLVSIKDGESDWTEHKDDAMAFGVREEAEKFLDEHFMETGGGHAVLRGDVEACSNIEFFYDEN